ncbi:MAG: hypothetical protein ACOYM4_05050, partial [Nodosilinea sp.]
IRTLVKVTPKQHFQCCAFNHSAISPFSGISPLNGYLIKEWGEITGGGTVCGAAMARLTGEQFFVRA